MAMIFNKAKTAYDPMVEFEKTATMEVQDWDFGDGEIVEEAIISFSLNPGRGTGKQTIPLRELSAYIEVLTDALDGDVDETIPVVESVESDEEYVPSHAILARNLVRAPSGTLDQEYAGRDKTTKVRKVTDPNSPIEVMLRSKTGRGAKASHLSLDRLPELISGLQTIQQNASVYEADARESFAKKLAAAAKKATKKA